MTLTSSKTSKKSVGKFIWNEAVMAPLACQLDHIWSELQSRNEVHTCERIFAWFEMGESTSSPDLCSRKTHAFNLGLEAGRHTLIWAIRSDGSFFIKTWRMKVFLFACLPTFC